MKKITKLMLTLAMLFGVVGGVNSVKATKLYATYGTPASEGSWVAETGVYTWKQSYSNLMSIFNFSNGELKKYKSLHLTTANYTDTYRICFMNGGTVVETIAFYSAGQKDLVFAERDEIKKLDLSQITSIQFGGASGSGSITITGKPYLEKPFELEFDEHGTAEISLTDLTANGCLTLNDQTGELVSTYDADNDKKKWGRLSINFPAGGVDLSSLTGFTVTSTGSNLFNNFEIGNGITNKGFWSNVTGRNDLNQYMTDSNVGNPAAITTWMWNANTTVGTMTISSITLKAGVITASNPHETLITTLTYTGGSCSNEFEKVLSQGETIYGKGNDIDGAAYIDLSDYDEMRIYGTPEKSVRFLFNYEQSEPIKVDKTVSLNSDGYYSYDLSTLKAKKLNAIKFPWDGQTGTITKVILYKNSVPVAYNYTIAGSGAAAPSLTAALADATATSFDATGLTNTSAIELTAANPNALFVANAGKLSNTKNVIVSDVCANLELTDGHPFKAPAAFTATNAKFTKTVSGAGFATMVVPFAVASLPTGVEAYNLTGVDGETITKTSADALVADKAVLVKAAADDYEFTATDAAIAATADGEVSNGLLKASYAGTTAAADATNYVLQKNGDEVNFYKVTTTAATVKPFRAYLTAPTTAPVLYFDLFGGETTGVNDVTTKTAAVKGDFYNLNGQRVSQPTKGLYIVGGKKVIFK